MGLGDCPTCWDAHCDCPPSGTNRAGCRYQLRQELNAALAENENLRKQLADAQDMGRLKGIGEGDADRE